MENGHSYDTFKIHPPLGTPWGGRVLPADALSPWARGVLRERDLDLKTVTPPEHCPGKGVPVRKELN